MTRIDTALDHLLGMPFPEYSEVNALKAAVAGLAEASGDEIAAVALYFTPSSYSHDDNISGCDSVYYLRSQPNGRLAQIEEKALLDLPVEALRTAFIVERYHRSRARHLADRAGDDQRENTVLLLVSPRHALYFRDCEIFDNPDDAMESYDERRSMLADDEIAGGEIHPMGTQDMSAHERLAFRAWAKAVLGEAIETLLEVWANQEDSGS